MRFQVDRKVDAASLCVRNAGARRHIWTPVVEEARQNIDLAMDIRLALGTQAVARLHARQAMLLL